MQTVEGRYKREHVLDDLRAELTEATYQVVLGHGVREGTAVDLELDLWRELGKVLHARQAAPARDAGPCEDFLAELTDAAYRVALGRGLQRSFLGTELGLWKALRQAAASPALARHQAGLHGIGLPCAGRESFLA